MKADEFITWLRKEHNILLLAENGELKVKGDAKSLTPHIIEQIKSRKSEMLDFFAAVKPAISQNIQAAPVKVAYELSAAQQRIFHACQFNNSSTVYNIPTAVELRGKIDEAILTRVFKQLINRHESLRTCFELTDEGPVQKIVEQVNFSILHSPAKGQSLENIVNNFVRPFNLFEAPLIRVGLFEIGEEHHILIIDLHHIVADGSSISVLINELITLYTGGSLPEMDLQYKDFSEWQRTDLAKEKLLVKKEFWLNEFSGGIEPLQLPIDFEFPVIKSYTGDAVEFELNEGAISKLKELATTEGVTLYHLYLAVYNIFIAKLSNQEITVIGSSNAGRNNASLQNIIGMFVNTLPIKNLVQGNLNFREFLSNVKDKVFNVIENQDYGYADLVNDLKIERNPARNPLFDVVFEYQNNNETEVKLAGTYFKPLNVKRCTSKFDLTLTVAETAEKTLFQFEYATELFTKDTINRFVGFFKNLLEQVSTNSDTSLSSLRLMGEEEANFLSAGFNATGALYSEQETLVSLLARQVKLTPEGIAVKSALGSQSYKELDKSSRQIALYLQAHYGVKEGDLVGVLLGREASLLSVIYGILRTGAAYVPIDIHAPSARQLSIVEDAGLRVVIGRSSQTPEVALERCFVEAAVLEGAITDETLQGELPRINSRSLAYVIYTSGTTGKPKGVMIEHHSVINRLEWMQKNYPLNSSDVILQKTPVIFDVSVWELFWWSLAGASVYLLEAGGEKDPAVISKAISEEGITTMHFVPSMLTPFLEYIDQEDSAAGLHSLKQVFASGEALGATQVNTFGRLLHGHGTRLINLYGPTEATVDVSYYECDLSVKTSVVPIGKPIDNTRLYVLSGSGQLCPIGMAGELCIAGVGLARGYLNNEELTAQKFTANPINREERIYHTGDLVKWQQDGNIEYLGRMDHQIKIRGYRVELGEIEGQLSSYAGIVSCVVVLAEEEQGRYLAAYYTGLASPAEALRSYLSSVLPGYMVPLVYVRLECMPLTATGKLDRKGLPVAKQHGGARSVNRPEGEQEELLAGIWSQVLGVDKNIINVDDNFFMLGGHSIKAIQLINEIYKNFTVRIKLGDVFNNPAFNQQAVLLKKNSRNIKSPLERLEPRNHYSVSSAQERLFYEYLQKPDSLAFNISGAFALDGYVDETQLQLAFQILVDRHESLRTSFTFSETGIVQIINSDVKIQPVVLNKNSFANISEAFSSFVQPFSLSEAPLIHYSLLNSDSLGKILFIDVHHIACDGVSLSILINDFVKIYHGETLAPLHLRYVDYAAWQKNALKNIPEQISFWEQKLTGKLQKLDLPQEQNTMYDISEASVTELVLDGDLYTALKSYSAKANVSDFMLLLSCYYILLSKISGNTDVIIGTDVVGRTHPELNDIVGTFINILPLRAQVDPDYHFDDFLQNIKSVVLQAFDNQDFQYDEMIAMLNTNGENTYDSIVDVHFAFANYIQDTKEIEGLKISPVKISDVKTTQYGFKIEVFENDNRLVVQFIYSKALYSDQIIVMLSNYYKNILINVLKNNTVSIDEIELDTKPIYA